MKTLQIKLVLINFFLIFLTVGTFGQKVNVGADLVSRYVWRGLDIANTPSLQPTLSISESGFEAGLWGAYTLSNNTSASDEIDGWLGYTIPSEAGDFTLSVIDYCFPNAGNKLGNFKNGDGAHTLEGTLTYSGPISLLIGYNFYNDPGNNLYFQIGYTTTLTEVGLDFFIGATPGSKENPGYYGVENFSVINIGITGSKLLKITEDFSLPIFSSFIINPSVEIAHLVFGISF